MYPNTQSGALVSGCPGVDDGAVKFCRVANRVDDVCEAGIGVSCCQVDFAGHDRCMPHSGASSKKVSGKKATTQRNPRYAVHMTRFLCSATRCDCGVVRFMHHMLIGIRNARRTTLFER